MRALIPFFAVLFLLLPTVALLAKSSPMPEPNARLLHRVQYFNFDDILVNYCDTLPGKKFAEIASEVPQPERMLYLCDQATILHAIRGQMTEIEAPEKFNGNSSFKGLPLKFNDNAAAAENGKALEEYDVWFSTQTHFGMRIANYTKTPISRIIVGFKFGDCVPPGQYFYEKLMMITMKPIPAGQERLLKWKMPPDIPVIDERTCMDIIRASQD